VLAGWSRRIPVGDACRRPGADNPTHERLLERPLSTRSLEHQRLRLAPRHFATLGGGNHFLELDRDAHGDLWLLVHTGSRGLGTAIAAHHLKVAQSVGFGAPRGLRVDTEEGRGCLGDLAAATLFAEASRSAILQLAAEVVAEQLGASPDAASLIDVRHNFVAEEVHGGRRLLVHRKRAIRASEGSLVLIPGSMATASYLAEGRGAASALSSASHGAGRVLTRSEARRRIAPAKLERELRRVVFDERRLAALVEEAPGAYRDIREVLEEQADLVTPRLRLEPLLVMKG